MTKKKKIFSITCLVLAGIVLVSGIIAAIVFSKINENSKNKVLKYFNRQLTKYEKLVNETDTKKFTQESALANKNLVYNSEYIMDIYIGEDRARIQMKLNNSGKLYLLTFDGLSFEDYDGMQFAMQLGSNGSFQYVYEIVKGKITKTYKSTEAAFFNLCNGLQKYLPDSYCGKGEYKSHSVYTNQNNESTFIITGDNTQLLFNKNYYFEETSDKLIRIKPNDVNYIFKIPSNIK